MIFMTVIILVELQKCTVTVNYSVNDMGEISFSGGYL